ncbi:MAG TPA: sulfite exporter TauE/SafE family protein [Steroidobacteraceae bacterium]
MSSVSLTWLIGVSFGASALGGLLGMASGIFIVPILILFGGIDIRLAVGASLVSVIACSCASAPGFLRNGLTNIRLAILLETATTFGATCGVLLAGWIAVKVLYVIFAAVLFVSAYQMQARRKERATSAQGPTQPPAQAWSRKLDSSYFDAVLQKQIDYRVGNVGLGLGLMYGAGLLSALLGIGSGVLKIPAMDTALRLPIKVSSATSNFMIGVTAAASAGAYFLRGDIHPDIAGPVALGSVLGAIVGAKLLMRLSNEKLRWFFIVILIALGVQMVLASVGIRPGAR